MSRPDVLGMAASRGLGYLAQPYTHRDCDCIGRCTVEDSRAVEGMRALVWLHRRGVRVISPTVQAHSTARRLGARADWNIWRDVCTATLDRCDFIIALQLEGWRESDGLTQERRWAQLREIPIHLLDPALVVLP